MPKNKNIKSILIIGSGPIVIGQACEFDYSGSQAAGLKLSIDQPVNSSPFSLMRRVLLYMGNIFLYLYF